MEYIIGLVILAGLAYWAVKRNAKVQPTTAEASAPYKVEAQPVVVEVAQPVVEAAPVAKAAPAKAKKPAAKPVAKKPATMKAAPKSAAKAKTTDASAKPKKPKSLKVAK